MARTDVPINKFDPSGSLSDPSGVSGDATNGHVVAVPAGWPEEILEEIVLRVANGDTSGHTVTVKAGDDPPANEAGLGDLELTVAAGDTDWLGPFPSSRCLSQEDGDDARGLWFDLDGDTSVTVTAFRLPRRF